MNFIEVIDRVNVKHLINVNHIMLITTYDEYCDIIICHDRGVGYSNTIDVSLEVGQQLINRLRADVNAS